MKPELKKLLVLNLPYLLFVYLFAKCGQTYRLSAGADASAKLLHLTSGISAAFASPLPSLHPFDLCVGIAGAVTVRLIVYVLPLDFQVCLCHPHCQQHMEYRYGCVRYHPERCQPKLRRYHRRNIHPL